MNFKKIQGTSFLFKRFIQTENINLKTVLQKKIPDEQNRLKSFKEKYGQIKIGEVSVNSIYGGMRGMRGLICETSVLDPEDGIRFRGYSIPECKLLLPKAPNGIEPLPEGMFWLLVTGEIPTHSQAMSLSKEWTERSELPPYVIKFIKSMSSKIHPMSQFSAAITILSNESKFNKTYEKNSNKNMFWDYVYEDCMDLIAKLPPIAALIYNNIFKKTNDIISCDINKDWSQNFAHMLGYFDPDFTELLRLYLTIHSDHEGGNVSAHTAHLVGSALSDPYLSFAAGMNGLAGPLHGRATQEVLMWLKKINKEFGNNPNDNDLKNYIWKMLKSGQVIPGYGHAVLRKTDPRYLCQREFALKNMPDDEFFHLVSKLYNIVPHILMEYGKVNNPWPNVDAHSGVLLQHYGMNEMSFYTVLFGVSRSIGILAQMIWSRALGFPIERPKSISTSDLIKFVQDKSSTLQSKI